VPPYLSRLEIWLGPALAGRTIRLWAGLDRVHVLLDGYRVKTLPSRLDARDLARLAAAGARPPGPPPLPPASGDVIEVQRTVNASGNVSLGNYMISAGLRLAGQRITPRLDGPVAHFRRHPSPHHCLPRPTRSPVPASRGTHRNCPAAASARAVGGHAAGLTRGDHGRRAEKSRSGWRTPARPLRSPWKPTPTRSPSSLASPSSRPALPARTSSGISLELPAGLTYSVQDSPGLTG